MKNTLFYSFFSYEILDSLFLLRAILNFTVQCNMRSSVFSISGGFYAAIRSILCASPLLLEEGDSCLGTVVREKMLEGGTNRKMPGAINVYKMHEMHKNLYLLWISNRWSCQVMVKRKINCNLSDSPELSGE